MIWQKSSYRIDDDKHRIDENDVLGLLKTSHWAAERTLETVRLTIENSLCFGLFHHEKQVGFARILTDYATYAVLLDMIILDVHRGKGLGKWMMEVITNHPSLARTRQILWTSNADGLYQKFDFKRWEGDPKVMVKPLFGQH